MPVAEPRVYMAALVAELSKVWPDNRAVNLVFHGHSVPAGYFATPFVDTFNAYPHLLHRLLKDRFPFAVINAIVTAIGGENAEAGAARFAESVLTHKPDVILIDYGLNDRGIGLERATRSWRLMIEQAQGAGAKVILLTPTLDNTGLEGGSSGEWSKLAAHAEMIRELAAAYGTGLTDSYALFHSCTDAGGDPTDLLSWGNHPNRKGHELVASHLLRWFAYRP